MYPDHSDWWMRTTGESQSVFQRALFERCLRLATANLIFDFEDKSYIQLQGLAMGVALLTRLSEPLWCTL